MLTDGGSWWVGCRARSPAEFVYGLWGLYAGGELIQPPNSIPEAIGFITEGKVGMFVYANDGRELALGRLGVGDYTGATSLTRRRVLPAATAGAPAANAEA